MWLRLIVGCFAMLFLVSGAEARDRTDPGPTKRKVVQQQKSDAPSLVFVSPLPREKEKEPETSLTYRVTLRCSLDDAAQEPARFASVLKKLAVREAVSISLFLTFQTGKQGFKSDGTPEAPEGVLSTFPVFVYNASERTIYYNGFEDCNRTFLLSGGNIVYVNPVFQVSKSRQAGAVFDLLNAVATAAKPLNALLGASIATEAFSKFNTNFQDIKNPLNTVIGLFDQNDWRPNLFRLFVAERTITIKDVGTIKIEVKPLESIVAEADRYPILLKDLGDQIKALNPKPTAGSQLAAACSSIILGLNKIGIRADDDIAYALLWLSEALSNQGDVLTCLGSANYAFAAANLPADLKPTTPSSQFDEAIVKLRYGEAPQPDYSLVDSALSTIVSYLSKFPEGSDRLLPLFRDMLIVENESPADLRAVEDAGGVPGATFEQLNALGYRRFGCFGKTNDSTGGDVDRASGMFLMFNADKTDASVCLSETLMVRPFFQPADKVSKLKITGNEDWIRNLLKGRDPPYRCGDGRITVDPNC